jgi:hypothetical protein
VESKTANTNPKTKKNSCQQFQHFYKGNVQQHEAIAPTAGAVLKLQNFPNNFKYLAK